MTFKERLNSWRERRGEETAVMYEEDGTMKQKSFRQFVCEIEAAASLFPQGGGKRICLLGQNSYAYLIGLWAVIGSGNTGGLVNRDMDEAILEQQVRETEGAVVLADAENRERVLSFPVPVQALEELSEYAGIHGTPGSTPELPYTGEDAEACILFSSGTGGRSKAVILTQGNLLASSVEPLHETRGKMLLCMPLHHIGGIAAALHDFDSGKAHWICPSMKEFLGTVRLMRPDTMLLVPAMLETLLFRGKKDKELERYLKTEVKRIYSVGAFLEKSLEQQCVDLGIEIFSRYGLTETAGLVTDPESWKEGSVGRVAPWNQVKIEEGEILIKGRNVTPGYLNAQDDSGLSLTDGWLATGDVGRVDEEGFLFISGRKKNLIILGNGENVSPEELEQKLLLCPWIREAVVYEENGKICGELYCGSPSDIGENQEEIRKEAKACVEAVNKTLPRYCRIREIKFREREFEKTSSMKIRR